MVATDSAPSLGAYEIVGQLAKGQTTDLLLARKRGMAGFERYLAVKRVRDERAGDAAFVEAFVTEARLAAALHHHNIVQVEDVGEVGGLPYFAMEYLHGEDLRAVLTKLFEAKEQLPLQHLVTIGTAVAAALHHAHEQRGPDGKSLGIVHRDVSPGNIIVGYDGNVKVVDFSMAKATITTVTSVGVVRGKAGYMAPEQARGERPDRRSDVYALGIVLYELAAVRRLFKGDTDHDTMSTIVLGTVPRPTDVRPDLPARLEAIIMRAMSRLPGDRYQSAAELGSALEAFGIEDGFAASTSALAGFMKQWFGEPKEPWHTGKTLKPELRADFDGKQPGIAMPTGAEPPRKPTPRPDPTPIPTRSTPTPTRPTPVPAARPTPQPIRSSTENEPTREADNPFAKDTEVDPPREEATKVIRARSPSRAETAVPGEQPAETKPVSPMAFAKFAAKPAEPATPEPTPEPAKVEPKKPEPEAEAKAEAAKTEPMKPKRSSGKTLPPPKTADRAGREPVEAAVAPVEEKTPKPEAPSGPGSPGVPKEITKGDSTELVEPLPLPLTATAPPRAPSIWIRAKRKPVLLAGIGGGALVLVIVAVIAFSGHGDTDASPTSSEPVAEPAPAAEPEPVKPEPVPAAEPPKPAPLPAAEPEPPKPTPVPAAEPEPPKPTPIAEPEPPKPEPPKPTPVHHKQQVVKKSPAPAKAPATKKKQPATLQYDPDSLFLKK
jgi:serine/threonine protein kinase